MALIDGLVSYYTLDETSGTTAYDSMGLNNGTNSNVTINQSGKIGPSYSFNGSNAQTTFNNLGISGSSARTISAWIKIGNVSQTNWCNIVGWTGSPSNNRFFNISQNDANGVCLHCYETQWDIETNSNLGTSNWHHIVIIYTGSKVYAYLDGVKKVDASYSSLDTDGNFNFGYRSGVGYFNGGVDEVGVWNIALTSDEVTALYNSGNGLTYPFFLGYTLNLNKKGMGSEGGIITLNPDKEHYDENEEVEISLSTSGENYRFHKFEGDLTGSNNPETIIMDDDKNVDIYFQKRVKIMEGLVF